LISNRITSLETTLKTYTDQKISEIVFPEIPEVDLTDYYTKADVYTKAEVDGSISDINTKIDSLEIPSIEGLATEN
jgi:hypothetical protein